MNHHHETTKDRRQIQALKGVIVKALTHDKSPQNAGFFSTKGGGLRETLYLKTME